MTKLMLILVLLLAPAFALTTGCYVKTEKEEVKQPPPAPTSSPLRVEERPAAPSSADVWRPGHWDWNGHEYVWVPGQWQQ